MIVEGIEYSSLTLVELNMFTSNRQYLNSLPGRVKMVLLLLDVRHYLVDNKDLTLDNNPRVGLC
jgi:hypothetical protein